MFPLPFSYSFVHFDLNTLLLAISLDQMEEGLVAEHVLRRPLYHPGVSLSPHGGDGRHEVDGVAPVSHVPAHDERIVCRVDCGERA